MAGLLSPERQRLRHYLYRERHHPQQPHHNKISPGQVVAEEMTLKIASYWLCGCGPRIMAEDFSSTNFAEENASWLAMGVPQMLVMTLLWSILACVLGRDTARRVAELGPALLDSDM